MKKIHFKIVVLMLVALALGLWATTGSNFGYRQGILLFTEQPHTHKVFAVRD